MPRILFVSGFDRHTRARDLAYEFERWWHHSFFFVAVVIDQCHSVPDTVLLFVATFPRREIMPQPARECPLRSRTRRPVFEHSHDHESIRVDASSLCTNDVEVYHVRASTIRPSFDSRVHTPPTISICSIFLEFERVAQRSSPFLSYRQLCFC